MNLIGGYANAEGDIIVLIDNDGTDPIVGEFAGLPEGSLVSFGGFSGQISYQGGDGNDLVLTYAPPATASLPWSENFDELAEGQYDRYGHYSLEYCNRSGQFGSFERETRNEVCGRRKSCLLHHSGN